MRRLAFGLVLAAALSGLAGLAPAASAATTVTCGDTLSTAGSYALGADCTGAGITITASNVTLNLNGHTMTGDGAAEFGVFEDNRNAALSGVTIQGPGKVTGYTLTGILLADVTDSTVSGLTAAGNGRAGIALGLTSFSIVDGGNTISGNTSNDNQTGIALGFERGDTVSGNTANHNAGAGIVVEIGSIGNTVSGNTTNHNAAGIEVSPSFGTTGNTISGNTAQLNTSVDLTDLSGACDSNTWTANVFKTADPTCLN